MGSSNGGVPPGFRFHPTDEELLHYYLKKKISFQKFDMEVIREVDLNKIEPWDLQERCKIGSSPQNEWYFFSHKDRKYPTGSRTNRATNAGFWKATGRDKCIRNSLKKIGMRKTLVFYRGRAPHGQKTDWIMHEYRLEETDHHPQDSPTEDGWVVCRVFKKKNLFKVENEAGGGGGGGLSVGSDDHDLNNSNINAATNHQSRSGYAQRENHQHYLMHQHQHQHHHGLGLPYSHIPLPPPTNSMLPNHHHHPFSSHLQLQAQNFIPTHEPPLGGGGYDHHHEYSALPSDSALVPMMQVKNLVSASVQVGNTTNTRATARDCESGSTDHGNIASLSLPAGSGNYGQQGCDESGLEVGTSCRDQGRENQNLSDWGMMDHHGMVTSSHHQHLQIGNSSVGGDDASKGLRFEVEQQQQQQEEDTNNLPTCSSANHINQIPLPSEMDFWGYGK